MELRLTFVVAAFAFIGLVSSLPHNNHNHLHNQLHGTKSESEILHLLKQIDEHVQYEVSTEVPAKFSELVAGLKELPHNVISSIDRQVQSGASFSSRKLKDIWNDALIMDASEGSLKLITRQILDSAVAPARKNYLLTMLAFVQKPSSGAVRAVLPLLEESKVPRQALLGVSTLIKNARKHSQASDRDVQDAVNAIVKYIKAHESSSDKVIVALKALRNLQTIDEAIPTVLAIVSDSRAKDSVRVAALEALYSHVGDKSVNAKLNQIFYQSDNHSPELRIAAYKALVNHPDESIIKRLAHFNMRTESNKQVGSFVSSHLANLQESDAPRHKEVRRILESEKFTSRFPTDIRKYSRNVELSKQVLGYGAVVDADIIYDQSIAPRSIRLNMSLPVHSDEINILEVGLRQNGFEEQVSRLLARNGPLAGKNVPEIFSQLAQFIQADNEVIQSHPRSLNRQVQHSQKSDLEASMYLNLDGKTIAYFDIEDLTRPENDMRTVLKSLKQQLNVAELSSQDRAFAFMINRNYEFSTKTGFEYVSVNGTVVLGLKADRTGLWPSMAMELSTRTPSKRFVQRINSSPALRLKVEGNKYTVSLPKDHMNILTVSSQAYHVDADGQEVAIPVATKKMETCSKRLSKALGVDVCARISGPKKMLQQERPYYATWEMELALVKSDNKMQGYEFTLELPRSSEKSFKIAFDTPRSNIKRNVAVHVQMLENPQGLRAKIDLPKRSIEGSIALRGEREHMYAKVELALEKGQKYSVEGSLKYKPTNGKESWTPTLRVRQPRSEPMTLTGAIQISSGNRKQITFELHNDQTKDARRSIEGTITREGHIFSDLKFSTDFKADFDGIKLKLYTMGEKKKSGSAQTEIKATYKLPNMREHEVHFVAKSQDLSKDSNMKINSFVELRTTQFPEKNIHISWDTEHERNKKIENELTIMWRDQMNDPRRKIHILQNSKFTGLRTGKVATADNIVTIEIAPLNMQYEIKTFGHLERSASPSYKVSMEVDDKINKKTVAASWEYRHESQKPLKMSIDASLSYPGRQLRYSDKIEEVEPRTYKGATRFQWAENKQLNTNYILKRRSESGSEVYDLDANLKTPSMELQHSALMRISRRDIEFSTKMNQGKDKVWDIVGLFTKDDRSAVRFEITGITQGKWEMNPFGAHKSSKLDFVGFGMSHSTDLSLTNDLMSVTSKTMSDRKVLFALNSKMNRKDVIAGPHVWEVRFQGAKSKTGEQKIRIQHEIRDGQAKGLITYFIKSQEKASLECYANGKSSNKDMQVAAGLTFKTQFKYHNLDGFHLGFEHKRSFAENERVNSQTVVRAHLGQEQKVSISLDTEKQGNLKKGQTSAKIVVETPVYDFKHQEAEFTAEWNKETAKLTIKGINNQNKALRIAAQGEKKDGRFFARSTFESDFGNKKNTETTLQADNKSFAFLTKVNEREVLKGEGKYNYNSPKDFTVSAQGKAFESSLYHALVEARKDAKQMRYKVVAKKDEQVYASGSLDMENSDVYQTILKMELVPRKMKLSLDSRVAHDLAYGPHRIEMQVQAAKLSPRSIRLTHSINNNQLRQNFVYEAEQKEKLNLQNNIFYLREKESQATKHTLNMEISAKTERKTYAIKHSGSLKTDRNSARFTSNADVQNKNVWEIEGLFSRSEKCFLSAKCRNVEGKLVVEPFAQTKYVKFDGKYDRYTHESSLEFTPRSLALKVNSKTMSASEIVAVLDLVRVPSQPSRLNVQSKWLDAKIHADMTKEPMTASFDYRGKTNDKTQLKASVSASKDQIDVNAEGECRSHKRMATSMKARRSASEAELEMKVRKEDRDLYDASARFENREGLKARFSLKKEGKELAATRALLNKRPMEGPNEIEIVYGNDESIKVNHELNRGKIMVSLTHFKAGSRKDFAEVSGQLRLTRDSADVDVDFNAEFAKKHANIKSLALKLNHQHRINKELSLKTYAKASINKQDFEYSADATIDPKSKAVVEMSSQSPISGFERQTGRLDANWSQDMIRVDALAKTAAGYVTKFNGQLNSDRSSKKRFVSYKIKVETPLRGYKMQESEMNAEWTQSEAKFKFNAVDEKARKIELLGESEIKSDGFSARGKCESEFNQIKSSVIEIDANRESVNALVKYNNKEILRASGRGAWKNGEEFNGEFNAKTHQSPAIVMSISANKIGQQVKYHGSAKLDSKTYAMLDATRDLTDGQKHLIELSLPTKKIKAAIKSEFAHEAANGPHNLRIEFDHPKFGSQFAELTHKIQPDGRIKCSVLYSKDGQTRYKLVHSGLYKFEVKSADKKMSWDSDFEVNIEKKTYQMHHEGRVQLTRRSAEFESRSEWNRKQMLKAKGKWSRDEKSYLVIESGEYAGEFGLKLKSTKEIKVEFKCPEFNHKTLASIDVKSWDVRAESKTERKSQQVMKFEAERRNGNGKIDLESVWADYRVEYDVNKKPMTGYMTIKTKSYKPNVDMTVKASAGAKSVELDGQMKYKSLYTGSLRLNQGSDDMTIEVSTAKDQKPLYAGRLTGALRNDVIKANGRFTRKGNEATELVASLNKNVFNGPHNVEIKFPGKSLESIRVRHEVVASQMKSSFVHMVNGNKNVFVEVSAKSSGNWKNGNLALDFNGETRGKKIMNIDSVNINLEHRHAINKNGFETDSQIKGFINRKDNIDVKVNAHLDTQSKAGLNIKVRTPIREYKDQELVFESNWEPKVLRVEGRFVNSNGKKIEMNGNTSLRSARFNVNGKMDSEIKSVPSFKVNGSADSNGFSFVVDKNNDRAFEVEGKVNSATWSKVDASIQGKLNRGPVYSASLKGDYKNPEANYEFVTREGKQELMAARANAQIKNSDDWRTGLELSALGSEMASFDLKKGECKSGHKAYIASYTGVDGEKTVHRFHASEVEPMFRSIKQSIRGF